MLLRTSSSTSSTLYLGAIDEASIEKHQGYRYCVTEHAMAHIAFREERWLLAWLDAMGLRLTQALPAPGTYGTQRIDGTYRTCAHMDERDFYSLLRSQEFVTARRTMSNGQYTLGLITQDAEGVRTVHTLNPNVHTRPVYDPAQSRALVG